jgi:hypothetical protein
MEGMYRLLWQSEILPELEHPETRELIDRTDPALRHSVSIRHGGTRMCRMMSPLCWTAACVQTFTKTLPHIGCRARARGERQRPVQLPLKPSEGCHRIDLSLDGEDGGSLDERPVRPGPTHLAAPLTASGRRGERRRRWRAGPASASSSATMLR